MKIFKYKSFISKHSIEEIKDVVVGVKLWEKDGGLIKSKSSRYDRDNKEWEWKEKDE